MLASTIASAGEEGQMLRFSTQNRPVVLSHTTWISQRLLGKCLDYVKTHVKLQKNEKSQTKADADGRGQGRDSIENEVKPVPIFPRGRAFFLPCALLPRLRPHLHCLHLPQQALKSLLSFFSHLFQELNASALNVSS